MMPNPIGQLDSVTWSRIEGWAYNPATPTQPVTLALYNGETHILTFEANRYRPDLEQAGMGTGHCAFSIATPAGWPPDRPHQLAVHCAETGTPLQGSPITLHPAPGLNPQLLQSLTDSLQTLAEQGTPEEQEEALTLLLTQIAQLYRATGETTPQSEAFQAKWSHLLPNLFSLPPSFSLPPAGRAGVGDAGSAGA